MNFTTKNTDKTFPKALRTLEDEVNIIALSIPSLFKIFFIIKKFRNYSID
jgi:hypothetical protein